MVEENPMMRDAVDELLKASDGQDFSQIAELVKKRELSKAMMALNALLLEGTPAEQEAARRAVQRLGFLAD